MKTWKQFLKEGISGTPTILPEKFTGIIQLKPVDGSFLRDLQAQIQQQFPDQKPITKLHITLLHQAIPKKVFSKTLVGQNDVLLRGDKALKQIFKDGTVATIQLPSIDFGTVGMKSEGDRTSTFIRIESQRVLKKYLHDILFVAGLDISEISLVSEAEPREAGRIFHISLTNLTGNPGDSLANINGGTEINI